MTPVNIKEEKFISENDVVATMITSDRPVSLRISGRSFAEYPKIVETAAACSLDVETNSIQVHEAGTVWARVSSEPLLYKVGRLVYDNMWGVLSASRPLHNVSLFEVSEGVCGYTYTLELDSEPTTLAWTMRDSLPEATSAVEDLLEDPTSQMATKTQKLNDQLNNIVPYFRCSDRDVVKVYYYLWSLHLLYYTQVINQGTTLHYKTLHPGRLRDANVATHSNCGEQLSRDAPLGRSLPDNGWRLGQSCPP